MLSQLGLCEFAVTKSDYASRMMKQELRNYEAISQTIDSGIEHAKTQIEQSKENLVLAKKIRKNRMEYDVLAKVITQQPDRKKTTEKLDALKKELSELEHNRRQLQHKLEVRRNDFTVLMRSIKELQTKLDDDDVTKAGEYIDGGDEDDGECADDTIENVDDIEMNVEDVVVLDDTVNDVADDVEMQEDEMSSESFKGHHRRGRKKGGDRSGANSPTWCGESPSGSPTNSPKSSRFASTYNIRNSPIEVASTTSP